LWFYGRQQQKKNNRVFLHIFFQEILFEDILGCLGVRSSFPPPVRPSDCGSLATGSFGAPAEVALDEDISGTVDGLPKASAGLATEFGTTAGTIFGGISAAWVRLAGRELAEVAGPLCGGTDPGVIGITGGTAGLAAEFGVTTGTVFGGIGAGPFDLAGKRLLEVAGLFCGEDDP
jgi:hypothetical protein